MIVKNDVINFPEDVYLNKCIQGSIPILNFFSIDEINQYSEAITKYNAEILSRISLLNAYIYLIMDNFIKSQKNIYLKNIFDDINSIRKMSSDSVSIETLNGFIKIMSNKLETSKSHIEQMYYLYPGTLSIYNRGNLEGGINYVTERNSSPIIFNYFEGRSVLHRTISLLEYFSKNKDSYVDKEDSLDTSHIDKVYKTVNDFCGMMKAKIDINSQLTELIDSCFIADVTYHEYNFSDRHSIDLFLGRKYSTIKIDIIAGLKNYYSN